MTLNQSSSKPLFARSKILALFATTQPEKPVIYDAVARLDNLPITFIPFTNAIQFRSVEEKKGDRVAHAEDKGKALKNKIRFLIRDFMTSGPKSVLWKLSIQHDIIPDLRNFVVIAEDSSLSLLSDVWFKIRRQLATRVPEAVLQKADKVWNHNGLLFAGPYAEYGPVSSAYGPDDFFNLAARGAAAKDIEINYSFNGYTTVMYKLSESPEVAHRFDRHDLLTIPKNPQINGEATRFMFASSALRQSPDRKSDTPIANNYANYFRGDSARALLVHDIVEAAHELPDYKEDPSTPSVFYPSQFSLTSLAITKPSEYNVRVACLGQMPKFLASNITRIPFSFTNKSEESKKTPHLELIDLGPNYAPDTHAIVMFLSKSFNRKEKLEFAHAFFATLQRNLLNRRIPFIVVSDHPQNDIVQNHVHLVNAGMAKDQDKPSVYENGLRPIIDPNDNNAKGVTHRACTLFDYIEPDSDGPFSWQKVQYVVNRVLNYRLSEHKEAVALPPNIKLGAARYNGIVPYRTDLFKNFVATSAGNDNRILLDSLESHCTGMHKFNKKRHWIRTPTFEFGVISGGGGDHAMGKVSDSSFGRLYHECYSTPHIIGQESSDGELPPCEYGEIVETVDIRKAKLIGNADCITAERGGDGSAEEILAGMIIQTARPDLKIIFPSAPIQGDTPFWDLFIKTFIGKEALNKMQDDPRALAQEGYFRPTSDKQLLKVLIECNMEKAAALAADAPARDSEMEENLVSGFAVPDLAFV